jgi:hypothetical protein
VSICNGFRLARFALSCARFFICALSPPIECCSVYINAVCARQERQSASSSSLSLHSASLCSISLSSFFCARASSRCCIWLIKTEAAKRAARNSSFPYLMDCLVLRIKFKLTASLVWSENSEQNLRKEFVKYKSAGCEIIFFARVIFLRNARN